MSIVRILLVDDFEPFRRVVSSILQNVPGFQVIAEASDGGEAVRQAHELQPDLIMLDIGLPKLSGIEAAERIRKLSPQSKILILSQESSAEIVQETLRLGASGYVVKSDAATELLPAVNAILQGKQFVSARLAGHGSTAVTGEHTAEPLGGEKTVIPFARQKMERGGHEVLFYADEASLLGSFTRSILAALRAGSAAIVVATESHRDSLLRSLQSRGLDIGSAIEEGRYIPLDVAEVLSAVMVNGWPDPVRFPRLIRDLIDKAAKAVKAKDSRIVACGEGAGLLFSEGKVDAGIRFEQLWNEVAETRDVDVLCGYRSESFNRDESGDAFQRVCAQHTGICYP